MAIYDALMDEILKQRSNPSDLKKAEKAGNLGWILDRAREITEKLQKELHHRPFSQRK